MKASLKFREDQNPIFRAKVPLNILGLPFQSGIVAGESKELSLNLSTFFESGPSIKLAYRPNDTCNPFSLVIKTGTGPFGSPVSSSMIMSAEFNVLSKGSRNPCFMLHFKPQFGDFSIKKSQSSMHATAVHQNGGVPSDDDGSIEVVEAPAPNPTPAVLNGGGGGSFYGKSITVLPPMTASTVAGLFSGMEVAAKTRLPLRSKAVVNFRWGVRVPAEIKSGREPTAGINFRKIPFLVMNKIGIEHVDGGGEKDKKKVGAAGELEGGDVAKACLAVKRELEALQSENGLLKKAVEGLREEIGGGNLNYGKVSGIERSGNRIERRSNEKKSIEGGDANEELKKALKGATSGGA